MIKQAKTVARGIDALVVNGYYTDERGNPIKQDLEETLQGKLRHLEEQAIAESGEIPTSWLQYILDRPSSVFSFLEPL